MNRKFISNSNDILRTVLNNKENLDILQDLIENILEIKIEKIILRPILESETNCLNTQAYGISDLRVISKNNEEFNIGIQIIDGKYIQEKILIYGSLIHANKDEDEEKVNSITINFLDLDYFSTDDYHREIIFEQGLAFHILELPKFKKTIIETEKDAWILYFKADNSKLIEYAKARCEKINKLDRLLENYWNNEKL